MSYLQSLPLSLTLPVFFLAGLFIGYGYFRALRETATLIVGGGSALLSVVLTLARLSLLATGFFIAVLAGGLALIATLAGLVCAKAVMVYLVGKEEV